MLLKFPTKRKFLAIDIVIYFIYLVLRTMAYLEIFIVLLSVIAFCYFFRDKNGIPTNWPLFGMLPAVFKNGQSLHAFLNEITDNSNLTFVFKGPWFTNHNYLITLNPANIQHVMSKNFWNYHKGSKYYEMFDVLGDGIFNADFTLWQYQRKVAQSFFGHPKFHQFLVKETWDKVKNSLIPFLDHVSDHGIQFDLQDLFARFAFDIGCTILMGHNPKSLSVHFPSIPFSKALNDLEVLITHRYIVPTCVWKLQRLLNLGKEKKHRKAWQILDDFIYKCIAVKREEMSRLGQLLDNDDEVSYDLLTLYMKEFENNRARVDNQGDKLLRDSILNIFIAGRDAITITLSWFFYLLSKNPQVTSKIKKELNTEIINWRNFKEVNTKLVYLHAALCETLRLYPPVPFGAKTPIEPDLLPSGHHVNPNVQILFISCGMGRTKSIWGDDCCEFKPERWISEKGTIRHEPSYKFFAFNAGPRACLGKEVGFTQIKIVAAKIIQNYVIEAAEDHPVPKVSVLLHMKHGFKVRILRSL